MFPALKILINTPELVDPFNSSTPRPSRWSRTSPVWYRSRWKHLRRAVRSRSVTSSLIPSRTGGGGGGGGALFLWQPHTIAIMMGWKSLAHGKGAFDLLIFTPRASFLHLISLLSEIYMTCGYVCAAVETSTHSVFLYCSRSISGTLEKYSMAERKEGRKEGTEEEA